MVVLFWGPLGIPVGHLGWLANPLMLLSAMPLKRSLKLAFAALAIPVAASSITLTGFPVLDVKLLVDGTRLGFLLWLACPVLLLLAALLKPECRNIAPGQLDAG